MILKNSPDEFKHKLSNPLIISTINEQLNNFNNLTAKNIQIDLSEIINIDSSGIAFLIEIKQQCLTKKYNLTFINKTEAIQRLADLYKITI
ncbi:MAG TPA: STAS domain-containing protein [Burkholderiales bacterium]|nr:STAS domain-containing protein [Burkholderiales bacterium]